MAELRIERLPITHPDAARMVEEVQEEYVARYGGRDDTPLDPAVFEAPVGAFFVGYVDGVPVATGAWRLRTDVTALGSWRTAEIKRMYVAAAGRHTGLARQMLAHLEATALAAGAPVMVLETGAAQPEAIALYESSGYTRIEDFGYYRGSPLVRCYGRVLLAVEETDFDAPEASALRAAQRAELDARYGSDDHEPGTAPTAADNSLFLLARDPSGVLRALEDASVARGWTHLVLETGTEQPEAIGFYEREGYTRIPLFGPYVGSTVSACLRRDL